jgi:hypothetical protein
MLHAVHEGSPLREPCHAGITWVLSDEVVHMSDEAWQQRYLHLRGIRQQTGRARVDPPGHPEALRDWLEHQKALSALGAYHLFLLQAYIKRICASSLILPWLG